ncbi:MAG TPA: Arc family DNA-binding protein [Armatimonadota bacterium]|nr:Arc family DNA-binding protein [Armatimonadota bacterium]HOS44617.1 Arc family DNA-binding protein [Armatimonadota bacterium]
MPQNLHIRNVPDDVMARVRESAAHHRRSVNAEVISILDTQLLGYDSRSQLALLDRINALREGNPPSDPDETQRMIREDRER